MRQDPGIIDFLSRVRAAPRKELTTLQTTFCDVDLSFDPNPVELWRIHYNRKEEAYLKRKIVETISVADEHPLLLDYIAPTADVHLSGEVKDRAGFALAVSERARSIFGGWRSYERYLHRPLDKFLEFPFGLLLTGPKVFAEAVVTLGQSFGVELFLRNERAARGEFELMVLDDLYVVAESFTACRR